VGEESKQPLPSPSTGTNVPIHAVRKTELGLIRNRGTNISKEASCHSKYRAIYSVLRQILCYVAHIFLLVKGKKEK